MSGGGTDGQYRALSPEKKESQTAGKPAGCGNRKKTASGVRLFFDGGNLVAMPYAPSCHIVTCCQILSFHLKSALSQNTRMVSMRKPMRPAMIM